MEDDDGGGAAERRFTKDVARLDDRRVQRADRQQRRSQHAMLPVEQHHAEMLDGPRPERRHQVGGGLGRRVQRHARLRRAGQRPAPQLHGGQHLRRLRATDSRNAREIIAGRSREPMQPAALRQQPVGDRQRAGVAAPAAEHQRDELVVAERRCTVTQQLLARPIVERHFSHLLYLTTALSYQLSAISSRLSAIGS